MSRETDKKRTETWSRAVPQRRLILKTTQRPEERDHGLKSLMRT